ncbi:hypothetical protein D3C75_844950 [compost metagenome]
MLVAGMAGGDTDVGSAKVCVVTEDMLRRDAIRFKGGVENKIHAAAGDEKLHVLFLAEVEQLLKAASDFQLSLDKFYHLRAERAGKQGK